VVIAKKAEAVALLRDHLVPGQRIASWIWVAGGPIGFSRMERARRRLDQHGIEFAGHMVRIVG